MKFSEQEHRQLSLWAALCAEHVLEYFEEKYPTDNRPHMAIEAARAWARGDIKVTEARIAAFAAHAAARATTDKKAQYAARAAGHAAATAHVATHSFQAAEYARKAAEIVGLMDERDWQRRHFPAGLDKKIFPEQL